MITKTEYFKCYAWQPYNIGVGTVIDSTVTIENPDGIAVQLNTLYPIRLFYTAQSPTSYDPNDESTWSGMPFYSGNLYLSSDEQKSDINDIIRDQLKVMPFLTIDSIPIDYYISSGHYELPLLAGDKNIYSYGGYNYFCYVTDLATNSTLQIAIFMIPNYTYDIENGFIDDKQKFSDPILKIIAPSQYIPLTLYTGLSQPPSDFRFTFHKGATDYPISLTGNIAQYTESLCTEYFMADLLLEEEYGMSIDEVDPYVDIADQVNMSGILTDVRYEIDPCIRYVLYYKNLYGGWDWMVVRGMVKKTIKQTTSTYDQQLYLGDTSEVVVAANKFINQPETNDVQNIYLPNTIIYNNSIVTELKINLGWFTDDQVLKLPNLFLSTNVYLHDLQENKFNSVIITDKSFDEKKYKEGKAINKYSIKVEYNQTKNIK